jgi:type IV pilus assembly protein PilV
MVRMGHRHNESGFTLTSVLIGTLVLTIGLLGAARLVVIVFNSNVFSKQLTTATTLAQEKMAVVQRLGYTNADTAAGTEPYGAIANYGAYQRVTAVSPNTPAAGIKTVTVTVSWKSRSQTHAVTLPTLFAK